MTCQTCKDWGRTITREEHPFAIDCSACGRLTWPNLGVNLPSGAAVSMGMANVALAQEHAAARQGRK